MTVRVRVRRAGRLGAKVLAPGDKSISHRALLFGALGTTPMQVRNLAPGADVRSTGACLRAMGVSVVDGETPGTVTVRGAGPGGFRSPDSVLDCGNSGTTMRLLLGLVAGARVGCTLDGDASLRARPMRRVLGPLRAMGARMKGQGGPGDERAPLRVEPVPTLQGMSHRLPIASAQVKSALVLAGLAADGETRVREPEPSRDHTERMLGAWGAPVRVEEPARTYVAPPRGPHKSKVPIWVMPVLIAIPLWAFLYPGAFTSHKKAVVTDPLVLGQQTYAANCASCHGATGGGGVGPALHGGQSKLTFPNIQDQLNWVKNGSQSLAQGKPYGDPNRPGGQHVVKESPGDMPAFGPRLAPQEIQDVVMYEREKL